MTALSALGEPQFAELVAGELGVDPYVFREMARRTGWGRLRFEGERTTAGWQERFRQAVLAIDAARRQRMIEGSVRGALNSALLTGLSSVINLTDDQVLTKLDPRLRRPALELDPAVHGGRLICGPTGLGKSLSLALVLRRLMRSEATARYDAADDHTRDSMALVCRDYLWVRAQDLPIARLQARLGEGEAELVRRAKRAEVLVLDDLGWEGQRAGAADVVIEVLADRYDHGRAVLATTGLQLAEVRERHGDAVVRRICEGGGLPGRVLDLWQSEGALP
jgi:hypothetical protein